MLRSLTKPLGAPTSNDRLVQAVKFPTRLDKRLTINLPNGDSAGWKMLDAPPTPAQTFAFGAVYSTPEYDVVQHVGVGTLKESIAIHRSQGTRTWRWKLVWDGGMAPSIAPDGSIRYGSRVVLQRPFLQDARGRLIRNLDWKLDGADLSVTVRDRGLALPYVLDPASNYPQRIHPVETNMPGSSSLQSLNAPPVSGSLRTSGTTAAAVGEYFIWSMNSANAVTLGVPVTNATAPNPQNMNGVAPCTPVGCYGALGWAQPALGGATLSGSPYAVQARVRYQTASIPPTPYPTARLKSRLWKIRLSPSTDILPGSPIPITDWSAPGPSVTWTAANQDLLMSATLNPVSLTAREIAPNEHVYVEFVMVVTTAGRAGSTFRLNANDAQTYIDFGGPATNTPGTAANLRVSAPTPVNGLGWTNDTTPMLRANLDDPDWFHHIEYQICTDMTCTGVAATGNSAASQMIGSATDDWTSPALANGTYFMRARTVEDGGDLQIGAWSTITPTTCTAPNVGACSRFGIDATAPTGTITMPTGAWYRGSVAVAGAAIDGLSGVASHSLQWRRISPTPAGPSSTGITCSGASSPTWGCAWDTTAVIDGTYELILTITDNAGNTFTLPQSSYLVDNTTPVWPGGSFSRDGAAAGDVTWATSLTTLGGNWSAATDNNTVTRYDYCLSTLTGCSGTIVKGWTSNLLALNQTSASLVLAEGATYFSCVRALDQAGNQSTVLCSDGQTVDTLAPTLPVVNDGVFGDAAWLQSLTTISSNWVGGGDTPGSGLNRWEYCLSTLTGCSGVITKTWTSTGTTPNQTSVLPPLTEGQIYYACVRGFDNAGNATAGSACSNGIRVDTVAAPIPASANDSLGADIGTQMSTTTLSANWPAATDTPPGVGFASGLQRYEYCVTSNATGADCAAAAMVAWIDNAPLTATSVTRGGLTLLDGVTYRVCVRTYDLAGNVSGSHRCTDGVTIDSIPPTWPGGSFSRDGAAAGDLAWTTSITTLGSNWSAATDPSGIGSYQYCLSTLTGCAGTIAKNWTSNVLALSQTSAGLTLTDGQIYYSCVRAIDTGGNIGAPLCSDGQTVDATAPTSPTSVNDGLAADITWTQSLATIASNWSGGGDGAGSGIARWEYCISTAATCGGTVVRTWTSNALATLQSSGALSLVEGQQYVTCVRAVDVAGNVAAAATCSNGQRVDTIAPAAPSAVNDGPGSDIAFTSSTSTLSANWTSVADPVPGVGIASGLGRYQYCITTSVAGGDCGSGATIAWTDNAPLTATTVTRGGLGLTNGATYRTCIRSFDVATNTSGTHTCSNSVTIDTGPPVASWVSWTENSPNLFGVGNRLWYNPAAPVSGSGTATATVRATDPGAGMNRVDFPNLGAAGWGTGGTDPTADASDNWTWAYSFTGGGAIGDPALNNASAVDNGGATAGSPALDFLIEPDNASPVVPAMTPMTGLQSATSLLQTVALGTDADSGVGSWIMDVQFAPLQDGVCQPWDPWIDGTLLSGYSGTAVNNTTLTFTHYLNDADFNGVPEYYDSFCMRTQVRVFDNVGRVSMIPASGYTRFDLAQPAISFNGPADGSSHSGAFTITGFADDMWAGSGPEYTDTGSGMQQVNVTYELPDGPDADLLPDALGSACPPVMVFTGTWDNHGWSCTWTPGAIPDGLYTVRAQAIDRSGRASTIATRTYRLDNNAPTLVWHSWNDNGSPAMHSLGNVAWVNPNAAPGAYQLDARVTAFDNGSGVNRVEFPALGAGWSPGVTTNGIGPTAVPAANSYTLGYTFANPAVLAAPGTRQATAFDGASNQSQVPYVVRLDASAPTGVSAATANGRQNGVVVSVALNGGSETALESGVGSWRLLVDTAPLSNDVCGVWASSFAVIASGVGLAPVSYPHDVTALGSGCYRYRLESTDNVGNVGTSGVPATAQRVDLIPPTIAITAPLNGSIQSGNVAVSGTASDAHSGIDRVALSWSGPGPSSAVICDPATLAGASPSWTYACNWNTSARPDGTYTITATSYDRAGNISSMTSVSVMLDNQPPFVGFHSFVETSPYTYWAGPVGNNELWYNPNASTATYSFDARITASDPSGISRVEFDGLGAGSGWTPISFSNQTVPIGPADRYRQTYTFDTSGAVIDPPTMKATAYDSGNNPAATTFELRPDTTDPAGGSISYATGFLGSTAVTVTRASGGDGPIGTGSGIASWELTRGTGTLSGASCIGWGPYATLVASGTGQTVGTNNDTVSDPGCFRYRLRVTDNVGNVGTFDGGEIKIDLAPPSGTLAIVEGTNPQWQHLASPGILYVNTNAARFGTFNVDVNAAAASGVLDVTYPVLAAGFTGDGVMPGPGPSFARTYSWSALASPPGAGLSVGVRSNSLGALALPFAVRADTAAPSGATVSHASGYTSGTSVSVAFTTGTDGTGSGILEHQLERETGSLAAGICTWSSSWLPAGVINGPLVITDATLSHAGCYRYRVRVTDNVQNTGYSPVSAPIMVDTTAPTGATIEFIEFGGGVGTALATTMTTNDTIYYDPARGTASVRDRFTMRVRMVDPESGPGLVVFPTFAGNWSLDGAQTLNADGASQLYGRWNFAVEPGAVAALVSNGAGMTTTASGNVRLDGAVSSAPSWSISYPNGYDIDNSVDVSWIESRTDDRSGFKTVELLRRATPYDAGTSTCLAAPFVDANLGVQAGSTYTDATLLDGFCYTYSLRITDQAENTATIVPLPASTVIEVDDIFPPAPFSLNLPAITPLPAITTGASAPACGTVPTFGSSTPAFTWTASSDAESGLAKYDVYVDGTGSIDGTALAPVTTWTSGVLTDGGHSLGVRAVDNQANFREAGPAFPSSIRIDSGAPNAALVTPTAGSWTVDTTPTLTWSATDANCLARVEVYLDGVLQATASGTESSWTPAAPIPAGAHTWRIVAIDARDNRTSSVTNSFGIDITPPDPFALTAPTALQTVRGFVNVSWSASFDADSGLAPAAGYRVYIDGVLRATLASGTTATSIAGITIGPRNIYVRAIDAVGNFTDTATVTFTGFATIPAPVLDSPANAAFLNAVPLLDWSWPSDGGPPPTDFDVQLDTITVANQTYPTTQHTLAADPGDGSHSWRVIQHDAYTGTVNSGTRTFVLDRTPPIYPSAPTRVATTVSWAAAFDPALPVASGIDRQDFWIDDGINPPTSTTISGTWVSRNYGVLPDGIYTMWIRAYDRAGNSTDSPTIVITNDSAAPTPFTLDAPAALPGLPAVNAGPAATPTCQADPTYVTSTPSLTWQASTDATSGLAGYDVIIDGSTVATVASNSYTVATPLTGGPHTWRVVARDNFGLTRTSTPSPMSVRVDGASPTIAFGAPADNGYTSDTTPMFSWSALDDNCVARVELTVGANTYMLSGLQSSFAPAVVLPEGPATWSLRTFDSAGNVVSAGPARTVNIDTTAPAAVTAIFPTNAGTAPEQMMMFQWSSGTDTGGSGVDHYDLIVDGSTVASGITTTTRGTFAIFAGTHTWAIRAYDAVGNSAMFNFTYTATLVPDVTPPNPFNLLTPADGAAFVSGNSVTWAPAWDFKGVTQYRIFIDGNLAGTTAGNVTTFTPNVGTGAPICTVNYDPSPSSGCLTGPLYSAGNRGTETTAPTGTSTTWNIASYAGWNASGAALGVGDPTIVPATAAGAGFDGDRLWTAAIYSASIPAGGADLRLEHRFRFHQNGLSAYDGGTIELKVDTAGDGFTNDAWAPTCAYGAKGTYGTTIRCTHEIVEVDGGYTAVMGGANVSAHPIFKQHSFGGTSASTVQTKLRMTAFAGKSVQIRFRIGMDSCFIGQTGCPTGNLRAAWRIDDLTLANPSLLPGPHTWYVQARDAAGNTRQSNQTWTFNLS